MPNTAQFPSAAPVSPSNLLLVWDEVTGKQKQASVAEVINGVEGALVLFVENIAALKNLDPAAFVASQVVNVAGYSVAGDGGGGAFYSNPSSGAADNGGTIIAPNAGTGRWLRVLSGTVTPQMFGCVADGVYDNYVPFQAAITYAAGANAFLFIPAGDYLVNSGVTIPSSLTIYGVGYDSHITFGTVANGFAIASSNVTIKDLRIDGVASRQIAAAGSYSNITITGCDISGATLAPVILSAAGIYFDGCNDVLIANNYLHGNGTSGTPRGYDIGINHGVSSVSTNIRVLNNKVVSSTTSIGIVLYMCSLSKVTGNEVSTVHQDGVTNSGYGILIYSKDTTRLVKNIVANNSVHDCLGSGFYFVGVDDSVISGNTSVNNATTQTDASLPVGGISVNDGNNNSITGNTIHTSGKDGIVVVGNYTSITGNQVAATAQHGIRLRAASTGSSITGNSVSSCVGKGIIADTSADSTVISGNSLKNMTTWSIFLQSGSNCVVTGNQINVAGAGITFQAGALNVISANLVAGGGSGGAGVAISYQGTAGLLTDNRGDSFNYGVDEGGSGNISRGNFFTNCTNENTVSAPASITSGATPAVNTADVFSLTYAGATNVTGFTGGVIGDKKTFRATNGNATIKNGATVLLQGGADFAMATNNVLVLEKVSATEWIELSRKT